MSTTLRIIALTSAGKVLAESLLKTLAENPPQSMSNANFAIDICFKPKPFTESVQAMFNEGDSLIFICSTGIVFRTLAPVLKDKYQDPPVLVLDEAGHYVVPVLSGHEGGANELAAQVSQCLGAQLVLTTAKPYLQPVYTVGMGCERHCPQEKLQSLLDECLLQAGLSLNQIDSINSIDIKADETGLIELAKTCKKPFQTFKPQQLSTMDHLLSIKSDYVFNTVGVYGVAEAAALFAASAATAFAKEAVVKEGVAKESAVKESAVKESPLDQPELILNKQKNAQATCAIARSYRNGLI